MPSPFVRGYQIGGRRTIGPGYNGRRDKWRFLAAPVSSVRISSADARFAYICRHAIVAGSGSMEWRHPAMFRVRDAIPRPRKLRILAGQAVLALLIFAVC